MWISTHWWHLKMMLKSGKRPLSPLFLVSPSPTDPVFFTKLCVVTKSLHYSEKLKPNVAHYLKKKIGKFRFFKISLNLFFLHIWSYFHQKAAKFMKMLILLAHFDLLSLNAPTFFSPHSHRMPLGSKVSALHLYPFYIEVLPSTFQLHPEYHRPCTTGYN